MKNRKKRCNVCAERLVNNKWCVNIKGCPIARKQKKIRQLLGVDDVAVADNEVIEK